MAKNYYDILGVSKTATQDEIKKAYRKLAHQHHPDKGGGDEAKFKEVNEAYQTLGNKDKRAQYDQFGSAFNNGAGGFGGGNPFGGFGGFRNAQGFSQNINTDDLGDLGDIFGDLFGGFTGARSSRGRHSSRQTGGEDIQIRMEIDFREAVFGAEKMIALNKFVKCKKCSGKGYEDGEKIITCPECKGQGRIRQNVRTIFGAFPTETVCPTCSGEGKKPEKFCSNCHGSGREKNKEQIKIKVPAGIDNGQTIRISGSGNVGEKGSSAGDLYITFVVKADKEFLREGNNILTQSKINISQASLGDKIEVNTLDGKVKLKIPSGTQSGKVFVLKNKGVPELNGSSRGDQLVEVIVEIPKNLSRKGKKLLEELKEQLTGNR